MSTNYYVFERKSVECPHCGKAVDVTDLNEKLHIGKSSWGWCFTLHVIPEKGLNSWEDWKTYLKDKEIVDEYGDLATFEDLQGVVENRFYEDSPSPTLLRENHAVQGPNNLLRHNIDHFCIGHGEGTWDLCVGEFC